MSVAIVCMINNTALKAQTELNIIQGDLADQKLLIISSNVSVLMSDVDEHLEVSDKCGAVAKGNKAKVNLCFYLFVLKIIFFNILLE